MTQKKAKMIYRTVGFSLTALCFVLSYVYRSYASAHHLNDFHLADCYTSFFGVPIIVCLKQAFGKKKWNIPKTILYGIGLFMVWELVNGAFARRIDWIDIAASCISGGLTYVLYLILGFKSVEDYSE